MKNILKHFIQLKMVFPFIPNGSGLILLYNGCSSLISQEAKAYQCAFL